MKKVYKYTIDRTYNIIDMPKGAQLLDVQVQNGYPQLWALVDPDAEMEERYLTIVGTGHDIGLGNMEYVGTYQIDGGIFIFHVFEGKI